MPPHNGRLHILDLLQSVPLPTRSGADLRAWHLAKEMARHAEYTILCRSLSEVSSATQCTFRDAGISLNSIPLARPRLLHRALKAMSAFSQGYPVAAAGWMFHDMRTQLRDAICRNGFDVVMADTSWLCMYWPILLQSHAIRILHLYDVVTDVLAQQAALEPLGWRKLLYRYDAARMRQTERRMARQADLVIVPSEAERINLLRQVPEASISVIANGVDCRALQPLPPGGHSELLYVGSMAYAPNADAVVHFVSEVLPILRRQMKHVILRVVGRAPTRHIMRLEQQEGVIIEGEVSSVTPYYRRAAALVVPLRMGGGTRLKILEALALGRPVISTTVGAEGLAVTPGRHLLIADTPDAMAAAIARVIRNAALRESLATEGRALVERCYAWPSIARQLRSAVQSTLQEKGRPREGAMSAALS